MTLPTTISQRSTSRRQNQVFVGTPTRGGYLDKVRDGINRTPLANKVITVTVTDQGDDDDIAYSIEDIALVTNSGTGNDATAIAALIAADINASPGARALVTATSSGADVILTGNDFVGDFDFDDSDAALSEATTTAYAASSSIGVGLAIVELGIDTQPGAPIAQNEFKSLVGLAAEGVLTAQVDTLALTYDATVPLTVTVEVAGQSYSVTHTMATDADTSVIAVAAALNYILPANTVEATHPTADTLTLTAEIAGLPFKVSWGFGSGADTAAIVHTSNASKLTDVNKALCGISIRPYDEETTTVGGTTLEYPANAGVRFLEDGLIAVSNSQGVAWGDPVYLDLGSTNPGKFFNTSGADRVLLSRAEWRRSLRADMAELEFDFSV